MTLRGNKGEWSELYAFFKLLADGRLYCGDGELNRYDDKYYPILKIFRDDNVNRNEYCIQSAKNTILITGKSLQIEISQEEFKKQATNLLERIKGMDGNTDFTDIEPFIQMIDAHTIKASSKDKADIRLVIHNLYTGSKPELGYSIKSKLGADSTLINSNKDGTNFIFKVKGVNISQMKEFNSFNKFKEKFEYLENIGATVSFCRAASNTLHNNLVLLDLGIERIIGEELLKYYSGKGRTLMEITKLVALSDPLCIVDSTDQPMYSYKVKQFLLAFALGMTSSTRWYGSFQANGGYIVVKEDGDIICYHFFDRNDLENYLFYNTRFDTPSTTRHKFGNIYQENEDFYIKLNLQVRFK